MFGYFGEARREKGFDLLPEIVENLIANGRTNISGALEKALAGKAEACRAGGDPAGALRASAAAVDLYRGDLLPDDDLPEIAQLRERLRARVDQPDRGKAHWFHRQDIDEHWR